MEAVWVLNRHRLTLSTPPVSCACQPNIPPAKRRKKFTSVNEVLLLIFIYGAVIDYLEKGSLQPFILQVTNIEMVEKYLDKVTDSKITRTSNKRARYTKVQQRLVVYSTCELNNVKLV